MRTGRPRSRCPATPRCLFGPLCPFRQCRRPPPTVPPAPHETSTEDALATALRILHGTITIADLPFRGRHRRPGASAARLRRPDLYEDPVFERPLLMQDRYRHWEHKGRFIEGCQDCTARAWRRKRAARKREAEDIKIEAIELGLPNWEDREGPEPEDLDPVGRELARAAREERAFLLKDHRPRPINITEHYASEPDR